jgi:ABC-type multidrug transport system fused ATPase/permease subunit
LYCIWCGSVFQKWCEEARKQLVRSVLFLAIAQTYSSRINTEQQIINCTNYNTTANENYESAIEERLQMTYLFPVALGILSIMTFLKGAVYFLLARKASINFHSVLMEKVTKAPMEFFRNHYLGHILNRFSEDLLYIDEKVPYSQYLALEVRFYFCRFSIDMSLGHCRSGGSHSSDGYSKYDVSDGFIRILHTSSGDIYILFETWNSSKTTRNFQ